MEALIGFPSVTSVTAINSYQSGTVIQGFIPSGRVHKYLPDMKQGSDYSLFNFYGSKSKPTVPSFLMKTSSGSIHMRILKITVTSKVTFTRASCSLLLLVGLLIDAYVSHYNDNSLKNLQSGMQAWSNNITKLVSTNRMLQKPNNILELPNHLQSNKHSDLLLCILLGIIKYMWLLNLPLFFVQIATLTGYTYLFMFLVVVSPNGKRMHTEQELKP
ncbi:unnamed protein product [Brassica oleracea var. botrytis]|uniref:BnaC09g29560D protein n=3 Tax=Brassica TaxID=3705 RepID=A0A078FZD3_BRANA|nr:hypothetical protein HID58_087587 [Brassica napus]CAF1756824.1 unnamed protein product [Brassica napus]CDY19700.1 BnaC09g29560D [Brassica napus]VDD31856.1 unnamed protein product [Brassica oleracea]